MGPLPSLKEAEALHSEHLGLIHTQSLAGAPHGGSLRPGCSSLGSVQVEGSLAGTKPTPQLEGRVLT